MFFPLPLTPFEEYMLLDDQPAYPMSCFFMLKLQGRLNTAVFQSALQKILEHHPLLTCSVQEVKGEFFWKYIDTPLAVTRLAMDEERQFPPTKGIDLFREPALKVSVCNENIDPATAVLEGQTNIVFEVHHSACDAAGIVRFAEDVLCNYAFQRGFTDTQREAVEPGLLVRRGIFGKPRNSILRTLPKQFFGIFRAWTFLMNRVVPLTPVPIAQLSATYPRRLHVRQNTVIPAQAGIQTEEFNPDSLDPCLRRGDGKIEHANGVATYPAILHRDLTATETQEIQRRAKQLGITINDLFLCSTFEAMKNWQEQYHVTYRQSGHLRIAVPTNLRTAVDARMPAANIVSMVFLDRRPENIQSTETFYQGVHREMQHIKRCHLGWAFIHGLTVYRSVFGSFRKMMRPDRCWATATVTNLGRLFAAIPLPNREGYIQIDESLELTGIEASPPVRSQTAIGVCVMTHADRMTINLHYDSSLLTRSDAQTLLDNVVP